MYPNELFLNLTLYDILLCVGILAALVVFRIYGDKSKVPPKLQNLVLASAIVGVLVGYAGSALMQSIYHYLSTGVFEIAGTTFYGGLMFGALSFLIVYFVGGKSVYKKTDFPELEAKKFIRISDIAACSITAAHGFGRLGCLMAGCCYGLVFDEPHWYTATFVNTAGDKMYALPTQLYEAIFLFMLCAYLSLRYFRKKSYNLPIYMIAYGVWRFAIEYIRGDDEERGKTIVSFLTPSQLIAVLMLIGGIILIFIFKKLIAKNPECLVFIGTEGEKKNTELDLDDIENDNDEEDEEKNQDEDDDDDDDDYDDDD